MRTSTLNVTNELIKIKYNILNIYIHTHIHTYTHT